MTPRHLQILHERLWDLLDAVDNDELSASDASFVLRAHAEREAWPVMNEHRFNAVEAARIDLLHERFCR